MVYDKGYGEYKNWILDDGGFDAETLAKFESVMCQGNGYMCVRAALSELASDDPGRYTLVAGTFDLLPGAPCNELPNTPDFSAVSVYLNGEKITPEGVKDGTWSRTLNMKNGLLERSFVWISSEKTEYDVCFRRVVSLKRLHLAAISCEITSRAESDTEVRIASGIDGSSIKANEHLEGVCASVLTDKSMQVAAKTVQSGITIVTTAADTVDTDGAVTRSDVCSKKKKSVKREVSFTLPAGETAHYEKTACVFSNRDRECEGLDSKNLMKYAADYMSSVRPMSFDAVLDESAEEWERKIWSDRDIKIGGADRDQLAARYALFQLTGMSPVHDNRMNIGAKGLSGPGYYGHAFWDTEMYMLPYFIFAAPEEARSLVEYRFNGLDAARELARKIGCRGARFPWESAWITDGEATPTWCDTGTLELHITADVAFGAYYYYMVSGDDDFMDRCGYELIFECATFWSTVLKYSRKNGRYEIRDVIGPNEYKTNIDNNAYTNYLAHNTVVLAMEYAERIRREKPALYRRLNKKLNLTRERAEWKRKEPKIYLPRENGDGIIPENDTFLSLPSIVENGVSISLDTGARARAAKIGYPYCMICKQADVVALLYVLEDLFSPECKKKNFYFYDLCCFHDSSLSLTTFSALAADLGEADMAYSMFSRASMIDIGDNPESSNVGVHAANLGGIWQCCVLGFGGVRRYGSQLRIQPNLPKEWDSLEFNIMWHSQRLHITENHKSFTVENVTGTEIAEFISGGKKYAVNGSITVSL